MSRRTRLRAKAAKGRGPSLADIMKAVDVLKKNEIPPAKCEDCGTPCYVIFVGFRMGPRVKSPVIVCEECGARRKAAAAQ